MLCTLNLYSAVYQVCLKTGAEEYKYLKVTKK